jgi:protein-L-isoaspartate(D-aspartate) O-methyltransferase
LYWKFQTQENKFLFMSFFSPFLLCCLALSSCGLSPIEAGQTTEDQYDQRRQRMVESQLESRNISNRRVLETMGTVPRHLFMPLEAREYAYVDNPVPIGEEQTISQPYIVALMTQVADPASRDRALEIGTGSGYQAAVLSKLVAEVYTIEIIPALAERARETLSQLGYGNVEVRQGDGYQGWPEKAPFEIILVTAAAREIPAPLIEQLAEKGRLVMPVGRVGGIQKLILLTKSNGQVRKTFITDVRFVPMTGTAQQP